MKLKKNNETSLVYILLFVLWGSSQALLSDSLQAQVKFDFHGFVNPHYYADSRAVVGGREDMMLFFPKPIAPDSTGNDKNEGWQANMMAITARLGVRISGPDVLGARTSAYVEGDFTGSTNATINDLRLRHAYINMEWERHKLLVGQYWYPMQIHEVLPMTNPLNMGAPFALYARYNQVRYQTQMGAIQMVAAASWQLDNMSQGLLDGTHTSSTAFARHSMIPELTLQVRYAGEKLFFGVAANLRSIQPQVPWTSLNKRLHYMASYTLFAKATAGQLTVKAQTLLNNSLYEGCSLGGYMMLTDGDVEDWHFNTVWMDLSRNAGRWRPGLFLGYAKNSQWGDYEGASHLFGRGQDLEYLWRVQPRLTFKASQALFFTAEAEYTRAGYAEAVGNLRLSLTMQYDF